MKKHIMLDIQCRKMADFLGLQELDTPIYNQPRGVKSYYIIERLSISIRRNVEGVTPAVVMTGFTSSTCLHHTQCHQPYTTDPEHFVEKKAQRKGHYKMVRQDKGGSNKNGRKMAKK